MPRNDRRPVDPLGAFEVDALVPTRVAGQRLDREVPTVLADVPRASAGAAGYLSYRAARRPMEVDVDDGAIVVRTVVDASGSLCKPLLGACVRYASCSPRARVEVRVPFALDAGGALPRSRATVAFEERCRVTAANVDVTPVLEAELAPALRAVEARTDAALAMVPRALAELVRRGRAPLALPGGACVRARPLAVGSGRAERRGDDLVLPLLVTAAPSLERPCAPEEHAFATATPAAGAGAELTLVGNGLPQAAVTETLETGDVRVTRADVQTDLAGLRVDATVDGAACGALSLRAHDLVDAETGGGAVHVARLEPAAGSPAWAARVGQDLAPALVAPVPSSAELRGALGTLDVPFDTRDARGRVEIRVAEARVERGGFELGTAPRTWAHARLRAHTTVRVAELP